MTPELRRVVEAVLMVAEEPVEARLLAQILEEPLDDVEATLEGMARAYEDERRGFALREVGGGWRIYTHPDAAPWVERFVLQRHNPRLSAAALETLAVIAYKQPVSRAQIAAIRGVNCDAVVRTLVQRGLIEEVGRDSGPGQAVLLGTTTTFLEKMGLRDLAGLPPLADFVPGPEQADVLEHALRGRSGRPSRHELEAAHEPDASEA
jgi:segregation and condensation protein B